MSAKSLKNFIDRLQDYSLGYEITYSRARGFACVTGNEEEVKLCKANPGIPFITGINYPHNYVLCKRKEK
jgi:hypothetical protein